MRIFIATTVEINNAKIRDLPIEYLIETTYKTLRKDQSYKEIEQWSKENRWQKLEVLKSTENTVEFKAYFLDDSKKQQIHHEKSTFTFENGSWFYSKGEFM